MAKIYADISDCLNLAVFECQVYGEFVERIPLYFRKYPERRPLYERPQGHSKTNFTIIQMIDRFHKNEHFSIMRAEDVVLISRYLTGYIRELGPMIEKIEDEHDQSRRFLARAKAFLHTLRDKADDSKAFIEKSAGIVEAPKTAHSILSQLSGVL